MTARVNLMFGVHSHQPVGNFDGVFRQSYEKCYLPFIEVLTRHPGVRMALHYSGPLLEWIEQNEPGYIDMIALLVERGQVEMLSGGFYEPILPVIPREDALGQIEMMNDYILRRFGQKARGLWLTERVWEPHMPSIIAEAGLSYTVIDETHFAYAGLGADDMFGYYLTEDCGRELAVFPIDKNLRYFIPFKLPEDTIGYLRHISAGGVPKDITYGDDGEKFGVWPETHKWVYTEGYLERLFSMIEDSFDWIKMPTFSEFIESHPPVGRIYLPAASYEEMMEWALPAHVATRYREIVDGLESQESYQNCRPFIRGGFWRNFLAKYPEANRMHKKMLHVSGKVNSMTGKGSARARRELWKGQCNCPYWHGLFGGLYLNYLRFANYSHLLRAEQMANQLRGKDNSIHVEQTDYDCDGHDEILVGMADYNFCVSPAYGGSVAEIDYVPTHFNITDVMSRRPEAYHRQIENASADPAAGEVKSIHELARAKEKGLEKNLCYDWYERRCFLDHFLQSGTTIDEFARAQYREEGDFVDQPFKLARKRKSRNKFTMTLERDGHLQRPQHAIPVFIEKTLTMSQHAGIEVRYVIRSSDTPIDSTLFAVELNLTLLAGDSEERYYEIPGALLEQNRMNSAGALDSVSLVRLVDRWMNIAIVIQYEPPGILWRFPIETVSQSEGGFEKTYQGSSVTIVWPLSLRSSQHAERSVGLRVERL